MIVTANLISISTVYIASPWNREYTYVPQDTYVHMYCTAENAVWSIRPSRAENFAFFTSESNFNSIGIYEGSMGNSNDSEAIHLIVRSGSMNNGTVIRCVAFSGRDETISETSLLVYGKKL